MIETHGLAHISLSVRDPERSLRFYRNVFGVAEYYRDGRRRPRRRAEDEWRENENDSQRMLARNQSSVRFQASCAACAL
jgi:catechol 2,3-dioxygenase-like lactoylglutathione lyase family enzyme